MKIFVQSLRYTPRIMSHLVQLSRETKVLLSLILISSINIIPCDCEPQSSGDEDLCRGRAGNEYKYPHWNDCRRYLTCSATGIQLNLKCPGRQVFDRWSRKCETSVDIPCNATNTIKSTKIVESKTTQPPASAFGRGLEVGGDKIAPDEATTESEYEDDTSTTEPIITTTEQENEDKDDTTTGETSSLGKITSTTTVEYTTLEPTRIPDPSPGWGKFTFITLFIVFATVCIITYCIYRWKTSRRTEEYYVTWTNDATPNPKYLSQETYV